MQINIVGRFEGCIMQFNNLPKEEVGLQSPSKGKRLKPTIGIDPDKKIYCQGIITNNGRRSAENTEKVRKYCPELLPIIEKNPRLSVRFTSDPKRGRSIDAILHSFHSKN